MALVKLEPHGRASLLNGTQGLLACSQILSLEQALKVALDSASVLVMAKEQVKYEQVARQVHVWKSMATN